MGELYVSIPGEDRRMSVTMQSVTPRDEVLLTVSEHGPSFEVVAEATITLSVAHAAVLGAALQRAATEGMQT